MKLLGSHVALALVALLVGGCAPVFTARLDAGLGAWTIEDALTEFGPPTHEKDTGIHLIAIWRGQASSSAAAIVGGIGGAGSQSNTRELILSFRKDTGKLVKWRFYRW